MDKEHDYSEALAITEEVKRCISARVNPRDCFFLGKNIMQTNITQAEKGEVCDD